MDLNEVGAARASGGLSSSRRGRLAAACENGTVVCVDEATAQSKPSVTFMGNTPFPATTVLLSPIGQTSSQKADHGPILTGGSDGTVTSWLESSIDDCLREGFRSTAPSLIDGWF